MKQIVLKSSRETQFQMYNTDILKVYFLSTENVSWKKNW